MFIGINYNRYFALRRCCKVVPPRWGLAGVNAYINVLYVVDYFSVSGELLSLDKFKKFCAFCGFNMEPVKCRRVLYELVDKGLLTFGGGSNNVKYTEWKKIQITVDGKRFIEECESYIKGFRAMALFKQHNRAKNRELRKAYKIKKGVKPKKKKAAPLRGRKAQRKNIKFPKAVVTVSQ